MPTGTSVGATTRTSGRACASAVGGVRVDRAVAAQMLEAVSGRAVEAALLAADGVADADAAVRQALGRDLEAARYDASLAARRHELVDPAKGRVAPESRPRCADAARARPAGGLERADGGRPHPAAPHPRPGPGGGPRPG